MENEADPQNNTQNIRRKEIVLTLNASSEAAPSPALSETFKDLRTLLWL